MMILLDTHVLIWAAIDPGRLAASTQQLITDPTTQVLVSAITSWEVGIKRAVGRLRFPHSVRDVMRAHRYTPLAVTHVHAEYVERLPEHHRDPFDRMLVAQAIVEKAPIVTSDHAIGRYDVETIPA